ncbi:hypothetical protein BDW71DRAFT_69288 [Aspergillus fruticulosus]
MPFEVFARWRPLPVPAEAEITRTHSPSSEEDEDARATRISTSLTPPPHLSKTIRPWKSGAIFTHVFEATDTVTNKTVFDAVVAPVLPRVLAGETANFLAYGHSGSGKSHTMIGYDFQSAEQFGLCLAAGREVFQYLSSLSEGGDQLGVGISMYELRGNTAFDLLNRAGQSQSQDKVPCHIREGPDGQTHIRGETETFADGRVRVRPITQKPCWTFDKLRSTLLSGLERRATGTSTIHDQSSRTHAVLELEIITKTLLDARDAVIERQSELVPVAKRATDVYLEENTKAFMQDKDGKYVPNPEYSINQGRIDEAEARKAEFEIAVKRAEEDVDAVFASCGYDCLGGKLVFVDLAGSEYYHDKSMSAQTGSLAARAKQTPQEQREGRQINTDLLALKEVIRARALGQARIPYRSSPLTMVLRGHFESSSSSSKGCKGRNKGSSEGYTAMILTVSPAATQFAATMNTLKYGNLVGVGVQAAGENAGKK